MNTVSHPSEATASSSMAMGVRVDDAARLQKLVDDVNTRFSLRRPFAIDLEPYARTVALDYSENLAKSLISAASALAAHRGSASIDEKDIALVVGKDDFAPITQCHVVIMCYCSEKAWT